MRHDGAAWVRLIHDPEGARPAIISEIAVWPEQRGKGWGSDLLAEVCHLADEERISLMLYVEAGPGGLSDEQLGEWYGRYGFLRCENDESVMVRFPQPAV
ncbi:GNAT family N-acetyltransferase [Streptomyces sp. NPDC005955]|uniref:GNAT family N-acetyltransferase n=1 Tax=Streptomyces sp. NPDC005955 TaxID=3364738 RepID=UPI00368AF97D